MIKPVDDRILELFVSKKYHWKSLSPTEQQSLAVEVMKNRLLIKEMTNFINVTVQDKDIQRKYRELIGEP